MKVYLDVSCLNRPFDDQTQPRVHQESDAVTRIFDEIEARRWIHVSSRMAEIEATAIPDETRRRRVLLLLPDDIMALSGKVFDRARELVGYKLRAADGVHVAAAEAASADVFLTCDDRLLRRCGKIADKLTVAVANPASWLKEQSDVSNA
jgi:predicted nucleic acid-binding protein